MDTQPTVQPQRATGIAFRRTQGPEEGLGIRDRDAANREGRNWGSRLPSGAERFAKRYGPLFKD